MLELETLPVPAPVEIKIELTLTTQVNVTDFSAQRQVSKFLLDHVGNLLYGEKPTLVAGRRLVWRVPVWFALPTQGPINQIGTLDVDVHTGELLLTPEWLTEITERGNDLAERATSSTN